MAYAPPMPCCPSPYGSPYGSPFGSPYGSPYGSPFGSPYGMGPYPMPFTQGTTQGNMADSTVGQQGLWPFGSNVEGYGVDLNHNGQYDRGQDGVLAFDLNKDGKVDKKEIEQSNDRLKAFGGNFDMNGDGSVSVCEKMKGQKYQNEMKGMDANHDGKLDVNEISQNGGRMLIDGNRDGNFQPHEQYSPYSYPTPGFGTGSLGYVDPACGYSQSYSTQWGWGWC